MPTTPDPGEFFAKKLMVPSELSSADWRMVPGQLKERIFFMGGVTDREMLAAFSEAILVILNGEQGEAQATRILRDAVKRVGYQPGPGWAGTSRDLNNLYRQLETLRTGVALANGWTNDVKRRQSANIMPALKLVRGRNAEEPRLWQQKLWPEAVAASGSKASPDRMAALIDDPVWLYLSDFGVPYSPLKWGSGMNQVGIFKTQAREWGLIPPKGADVGMGGEGTGYDWGLLREEAEGLTEAGLREAIGSWFGGVAEWCGDRLVYTEPNGTTVYGLDELAWVLTHPPGELSGSRQLCALWEWRSLGRSEAATAAFVRKWTGQRVYEDFDRLSVRLRASDPGAELTDLLWGLVERIERLGFE
jgi:hypothetical protein